MISGWRLREGAFYRARDFFAYHRAHRAADESEFHRTADDRAPIRAAFGGEDGVFHSELVLRFFQTLRVGTCVSVKWSGSFEARSASYSV